MDQKESRNESASRSSVKIERFISSEIIAEPYLESGTSVNEGAVESILRPQTFEEYPGQDRAKNNLKIFVEAAKRRGKPLDHVLLHGPPGLGKTSLARIVARELGVNFVQTSGPAVEKAGDLAGILTGLSGQTVLFIDEIHRLNIVVEEVLYSAMEDSYVDLVVGQGPTARSVKMPIEPFTLIGATTKVASLSQPLISRFGIQERFEFYDDDSLSRIILRSAHIEGFTIGHESSLELARRSRGTPRIANRLLRRVADFALVAGEPLIGVERIEAALGAMDIDANGLDPLDRKLLSTLLHTYGGGPVGIEALSQSIAEDRSTVEEVYEPFLVHKGWIKRGPRGRELTSSGRHIVSQYDREL
jgi:Holliday junction DNA helicase RuvB